MPLKRVILIGDSIRMGYEATVRELLGDEAVIISPESNGGDSRNVLAHLDEWVTSQQPDIVHLNCGLHDLKRPFEPPQEAQVSLDEYLLNLMAIFTSITTQTSATLIWATTTPVNGEKHHAIKGFDRWENDVDAYNATALMAAKAFNLPVDDLFAVIMHAGKDDLLRDDGVHFTAAGSRLLGERVAAMIRLHLR